VALALGFSISFPLKRCELGLGVELKHEFTWALKRKEIESLG